MFAFNALGEFLGGAGKVLADSSPVVIGMRNAFTGGSLNPVDWLQERDSRAMSAGSSMINSGNPVGIAAGAALEAGGAVDSFILEQAKGLNPMNVIRDAQAPVRAAQRTRDQLLGRGGGVGFLERDGVQVDVGSTASKLSAMTYDDKWRKSNGKQSTRPEYSGIRSEHFLTKWNGKRKAESGIHAIAYEQDGYTYVAFRGTEDAGNWFDNLNFAQKDLGNGMYGHQGFYDAYNSIGPQIQSWLAENVSGPVVFTGHSLGGAMAQYAALYYTQANPDKADVSLVTQGAPASVGPVAAAYLDAHTQMNLRMENKNDLVPQGGKGLYSKGNATIMSLENPIDQFYYEQVGPQNKNFWQRDHEAIEGNVIYSRGMTIADALSQVGHNALNQHDIDRYIGNYGYYNMTPTAKLLSLNESLDKYITTQFEQMMEEAKPEQTREAEGAVAATGAEEAWDAAKVRTLGDLVEGTLVGVRTQIGKVAAKIGVEAPVLDYIDATMEGYIFTARAESEIVQASMVSGAELTPEEMAEAYASALSGKDMVLSDVMLDSFGKSLNAVGVSGFDTLEATKMTMKAVGESLIPIGVAMDGVLALQSFDEALASVVDLQAADDAKQLISDSFLMLSMDDTYTKSVEESVKLMGEEGLFSVMDQLTDVGMSTPVIYDSGNPGNVWFKGQDADGYEDWFIALTGDAVTGSSAEVYGLIVGPYFTQSTAEWAGDITGLQNQEVEYQPGTAINQANVKDPEDLHAEWMDVSTERVIALMEIDSHGDVWKESWDPATGKLVTSMEQETLIRLKENIPNLQWSDMQFDPDSNHVLVTFNHVQEDSALIQELEIEAGEAAGALFRPSVRPSAISPFGPVYNHG